MGQEILYCSRCQVRIVGGDFDKGEAYRVGEQVACQKCAMDMLAKSPVAIQQQILDQKQRALDKKMPSRGPTGSSTATRAPRETAPSKVPVAAMIGIGVTLVILVGMLAMSGSPPPPAPPPPPPPKVANTGPTPQETALAQAKRELEATEKKRKELIAAEMSELLSRAREMNGEHQKAVDLLEGAKKNHAGPEWTKPLEDRIKELQDTMAAEFPSLRDKAVDARKRDGTAEVALIREKVQRWGSARYSDELDKSLAEVFPPVTPRGGGVIKLTLAEATLLGNNKFRRTPGEWKVIQSWTDPKDSLLWNVAPRQAGAYTIRMNYAVPKEMTGKPFGGEFEIAVAGGEAKQFTVEPTASWGDFKTVTFGTITLPAATCTVSMRPVKIVNNLMSLHYIELVPVK